MIRRPTYYVDEAEIHVYFHEDLTVDKDGFVVEWRREDDPDFFDNTFKITERVYLTTRVDKNKKGIYDRYEIIYPDDKRYAFKIGKRVKAKQFNKLVELFKTLIVEDVIINKNTNNVISQEEYDGLFDRFEDLIVSIKVGQLVTQNKYNEIVNLFDILQDLENLYDKEELDDLIYEQTERTKRRSDIDSE